MKGYEYLFLSIAYSLLVFVVGVAGGITSRKLAAQDLSKLHLAFLPFLLLTAWWMGLPFGSDTLVGIFLYFSAHYLLLLNIFGIPRRSFSANICIAIYESGDGGLPIEQVEQAYGQKEGIKILKKIRLEAMTRNNMVHIEKGRVSLTSFGKACTVLHRWVLFIWNLKSNEGAR